MFLIGNLTGSHTRPWVEGAFQGNGVLAPGDTTELDVPVGTKVELRRILDDVTIGAGSLDAKAGTDVQWIVADPPTAAPQAELSPPLSGIPQPPAVLNARGELPGWQDYVTVATKKVPAPEDDLLFNTRACPIRRSVTISASYMEWLPTRDPALRGYEGADVLDLAELVLVADHIVVAAPLRFPGTNVTIRCRTLEFRADGAHSGSIDTTPLDFPVGVPAYSSTRWSNDQDPDDHTSYPGIVGAADAVTRAPTGQPGARGQDAGTITLNVKELLYPLETGMLFIGHGGRGEEGEPGGLEPRAKGDTMPSVLTRADVAAVVKNFVASDAVSSWRWPSAMYRLLDANSGPTNVAYARVLFVDDVAFEDDTNEYVLGTTYRKYTACGDANDPDDFWNRRGDSAATPQPPKYPAGPAAYPGGAPGDSGSGADVRFSLSALSQLKPHIDNSGGTAAAATPGVAGAFGRAGIDLIAVDIVAMKSRGLHTDTKFNPESRMSSLATTKGADTPAQPSPPPGSAGQLFDGAVSSAHATMETHQRIAAAVGTCANWLDPASLDAVLAQARDTFRAGFRQEAWELLEPYYGERLAKGDVPQPQAVVIDTLRGRLNANLDYRGRPVGYVPKLDAMSSFSDNQTIRVISQRLIAYADDAISAFDQLEEKVDTFEATRQGIASKIEQATAQVREGMQTLQTSADDLEEVTRQVQAKAARVQAVTAEATLAAKDQVTAQDVFSGCCHLIGGVMQAIPVGQPYLGLAGAAVGTVGDFTITAPPGQDSAAFFADQTTKLAQGLGGDVKTFLNQNQDQIKLSATADPQIPANQSKIGELSVLIAKAQAGLTTDEQAAATATGTQLASLETIATQAGTVGTDRVATKQQLASAMAERAQLQSKAESAFDDWYKARIGHGGDATATKKAYDDACDQLVTNKEKVDTHTKAMSDLDAAVATAKRGISQAKSDQSVLDAQVAKAKADQDNRRQQVTDVCGRLRSAGDGLTGIGAGIGELIRAAHPSDSDPVVQEIVRKTLASSPDFAALQKEFAALADKQTTAIATLRRAQAVIRSAHADIATGLDQITALTSKVTSMSSLADARTRQHLVELRERGREYARESIDTLVAALRYEFVMDIRPDALDDTIGVKIGQIAAAGAGSTPTNGQLSALDTAYWAALCTLALQAERATAQRGTPNPYTAHTELAPALLAELTTFGQVTTHGVYDLRILPTFTWHAARVRDIRIKSVDTEPRLGPNDYLDLLVEHSGSQLILEQEENPPDGDPSRSPPSRYYFFQGGTDEPRQWSARAQTTTVGGSYEIAKPKDDGQKDREDLLKMMLSTSSAVPAASVKLAPYKPGVYSLFRVVATRPPGPDHTTPPLPTITQLTLEIDYSASFDESPQTTEESPQTTKVR